MKNFLIIALFYIPVAYADKEAHPISTASVSENGKFAYVYWVSGKPQKGEILEETFKKYNIDSEIFSKSGLYDLRTKKLLWSLSNHKNYEHFNADVLNDGKHLVVFGPWASSPDDMAYELYRENHLVKRFAIKDICNDDSTYRYSVSHFTWQHKYSLDNNKKEISFRACRKKITINVTSGEMSSALF